MKFRKFIKNFEKKGVISKKPHPIIPFILTIIILLLGIIVFYFEINKNLAHPFFWLAGFSFIFSIIHWIIVRILRK